MSKVSRSTYQKCAEENKRLKKDIETLVMMDNKKMSRKVFNYWYEHFTSKRLLDSEIKQVIINSQKDESKIIK